MLHTVAEGRVEVSRENKYLSTLAPGKVFGELAILYNCKRTATIKGEYCFSFCQDNCCVVICCTCVNNACSASCSCHRLQAMGHRAPVFPDYYDAYRPYPTGGIHRLPQEVSSASCHSCGTHCGSSSCSVKVMFVSAYVSCHSHVLWADTACFKFRITWSKTLPMK
jgi:hypothetical protein